MLWSENQFILNIQIWKVITFSSEYKNRKPFIIPLVIIKSSIRNKYIIPSLHLIEYVLQKHFPEYDPSMYQSVQINYYKKETVFDENGKKITKSGVGIINHADNPTTAKGEYEEYYFDAPIYMIALKGSGVLHQGVKQHGIIYDSTQQYAMYPGSIMKMDSFAFWNHKHAVLKHMINESRMVLILRPIHDDKKDLICK